MMRVDGSYLYVLGSRFHPLADISANAEVRGVDALYPLYLADTSLQQLLQNRYFGLRTCIKPAEALAAAIKKLTLAISKMPDPDQPLNSSDIWQIKQQAQSFESVLTAELGTTDFYYVIPKGSHSMVDLITNGLCAFPDDVREKTSGAIYDLQEATRCLAFARFTACGFHLHRANEAVLRKYWETVTNGATPPKQESMGAYIGELKRRKKGKAKVRNILTELKTMHRNPIIHPEHTLDQKQALALMGVINASITYMLEEIPLPLGAAPPTPSALGSTGLVTS